MIVYCWIYSIDRAKNHVLVYCYLLCIPQTAALIQNLAMVGWARRGGLCIEMSRPGPGLARERASSWRVCRIPQDYTVLPFEDLYGGLVRGPCMVGWGAYAVSPMVGGYVEELVAVGHERMMEC